MLLFAGVAVLLLVLAAIVEHTDCAPLAGTKNDTKRDEELFEGDIVISEEMIRHYYNITDYELKTGEKFHFNTRSKRGATNQLYRLWPNGIVYYMFDPDLPVHIAMRVRDAMDDFEKKTCLRFGVNRAGNRIKIVSKYSGCWSMVGMFGGGEQELNLQYPNCDSFGITLHEIGHAIGFFHEQSRPDRDSYVNVLYVNIPASKRYNFMKRNDINSLGVKYDYGSIMHYGTHAFSRNGQPTIQVNNPNAYTNQGNPKIGQRIGLSAKDIEQVNLLYSCPKTGTYGRLRIKVRCAVNLPDTDPWLNAPDPYVRITAIHTSTVTRHTSVKSGTQNPTWNELIDLGVYQWKYFRVQMWDDDNFFDDAMSVSETFALTATGSRKNVKHCTNPSCSGYLWLDYYLCPNGWSGDNCAHKWANLRFFICFGRNLPDEDGWWNDSDPYVEVIAYNLEGTSVRKITSTKNGDQSPDWNENLQFGFDAWKRFKIKVWDSDYNADDPLSNQQMMSISYGTHAYIVHKCNSGYIKFDYQFL